MIIKQIKLQNIQIHTLLTLNPRKGINVVWGKSAAGKSCRRRRIK